MQKTQTPQFKDGRDSDTLCKCHRAGHCKTTRSTPAVPLQTAAHVLDRLGNVTLLGCWLVIHLQAKWNAWPAYLPSPFAQPPAATPPQPMRSLHQQWAPRRPGLLGDNLDNSLDSGRTGGGCGTAGATTANATRLMFNSPGGNCKTCSHSWTGMPSGIGPLECSNKRYHVCDLSDGKFGTPSANSSSRAKTREERPTGDHVSAVERREARLTHARPRTSTKPCTLESVQQTRHWYFVIRPGKWTLQKRWRFELLAHCI